MFSRCMKVLKHLMINPIKFEDHISIVTRDSVNAGESFDGETRQSKKILTNGNSGKSTNESITFRIYSDAVARLRREANDKDISFNTLVNQILKSHVEWHSVAADAGFISARRGFVKTLIDRLSDEEVKILAKQVAQTTNHDILMIFKNKVNTESAILFLEAWLRASGFPYRYGFKADNTHSFVIQHDMGRKWAFYLGELFGHMFEECQANKFAYEARESTLSLLLEGQIEAKNN